MEIKDLLRTYKHVVGRRRVKNFLSPPPADLIIKGTGH